MTQCGSFFLWVVRKLCIEILKKLGCQGVHWTTCSKRICKTVFVDPFKKRTVPEQLTFSFFFTSNDRPSPQLLKKCLTDSAAPPGTSYKSCGTKTCVFFNPVHELLFERCTHFAKSLRETDLRRRRSIEIIRFGGVEALFFTWKTVNLVPVSIEHALENGRDKTWPNFDLTDGNFLRGGRSKFNRKSKRKKQNYQKKSTDVQTKFFSSALKFFFWNPVQ